MSPMSESHVQWQGWIKPTESHIADLKAKFTIGGRKPPDITPEGFDRGFTSTNPEI